MREIEETLLTRSVNKRQNIFVLRGLGGIGKTQLAVEFIRRHHDSFTSVFWLDGSSEDTLRRTMAGCACRIPSGQISDSSRALSNGDGCDINEVIAEVKCWLARPDNSEWLLVFDNADREYGSNTTDTLAYDIEKYYPQVDHGSVLITTRLAKLEQLGESRQVDKVNRIQAEAILRSRCGGEYGKHLQISLKISYSS